MRLILCAFLTLRVLCATAAEREEPKTLEDVFVRGVYWPWERTAPSAKKAGKEFWKFTDETLECLKRDYHCNLVWVVNLGTENSRRFCDIAEKYDIRVLADTPLINLSMWGIRSEEQVDETIRKTVEAFKDKKCLAGYLFKDEPYLVEAAQMEYLRKKLEALDPTRPAIVVTTSFQSQAFAERTNFPYLCEDPYGFGVIGSPYIPNTPAASQYYFRYCARKLVSQALAHGKKPWIMPQAFIECWGPWYNDEKMNVIVAPGGYLHWRMPTPEEVAWQTWEAMRSGCAGIVFFTLLSPASSWNPGEELPEKWIQKAKENKTKSLPVHNETWNTNNPGSLLYLDGSPSRQIKAMAKVFGVIKKYENLLIKLKPSPIPVLFSVDPDVDVSTFIATDENDARYCILVNNNLKNAVTTTLYATPNTKTVTTSNDGFVSAIETKKTANSELLSFAIKLESASGTILRIELDKKRNGILLFDEDFSLQTLGVKLENAVREPIPGKWNTGWDWGVRKKDDTSPDAKGHIVLRQVFKSNPPSRKASPTGLTPGADFLVYMIVEGDLKVPEDCVVTVVGDEKGETWLKTDAYRLPFKVPGTTKELKITITDKAIVDRLLIWAIPNKNTRNKK